MNKVTIYPCAELNPLLQHVTEGLIPLQQAFDPESISWKLLLCAELLEYRMGFRKPIDGNPYNNKSFLNLFNK